MAFRKHHREVLEDLEAPPPHRADRHRQARARQSHQVRRDHVRAHAQQK